MLVSTEFFQATSCHWSSDRDGAIAHEYRTRRKGHCVRQEGWECGATLSMVREQLEGACTDGQHAMRALGRAITLQRSFACLELPQFFGGRQKRQRLVKPVYERTLVNRDGIPIQAPAALPEFGPHAALQ